MMWICFIVMLAVPYLLGGINTSIIVTKLKTGKDIRTMGSGNAGLTNSLRTQGKAAACIVLVGDVLKSVLAVIITYLVFFYAANVDIFSRGGIGWVGYMAAFMTVVGHVFPVYYGFKGGKGVLAAISAIFVLDWRTGLVLLAVFIILVAATRYVSLGSCVSSALYCVCTAIFRIADNDPAWIVETFIAAFTGGLIIYKHRANIRRLMDHNEKKLGEKAK